MKTRYNLFRWYEASSGRYLRTDPVNLGRLGNRTKLAQLPVDRVDAYYLAMLRAGNPEHEGVYLYGVQNPVLFYDPLGLFGAGALATAGGACVAIDGPLPLGDVIGVPLLAGAMVWAASETVKDWWKNRDKCDDCDQQDIERRCDALYVKDIAECQRRHGPSSHLRAACYGSASERYGNCLAGRPVGPLSP